MRCTSIPSPKLSNSSRKTDALTSKGTIIGALKRSSAALPEIQIVERKQNLPSLTPKDSFIATKAVEGIIGQIAEPQETTRKLNGRSNLALA